MEITKILDKATCFLIDPSNNEHSPVEEGFAWITTIATGILSLGIIHGLSVAWRRLQQVKKNDTHEKISQLFQKLFGSKQNKQVISNPQSPPTGEVVREEVPYTHPVYLSLVKTIESKKEFGINPLSTLLPDVCQHILDFTDAVTFSRLTTSSAGMAEKTSIYAINQIKNILAVAIEIDKEIKKVLEKEISIIGTNEKGQIQNEIEARINTNFFKFDSLKWGSVINDLNLAITDKRAVVNSSYLIEECKQDLLEALAEYNVQSYHILNNQNEYDQKLNEFIAEKSPGEDEVRLMGPKKYLELLDKNILAFKRQNRFLDLLTEKTLSLSASASQILEEAKKLGKFTLCITNNTDIGTVSKPHEFATEATHSPLGPYFEITLLGCECGNRALPFYCSNAGNFLHYDWLIGKKQGDRLIISSVDGDLFIIRFMQKIENYIMNSICALEARKMRNIQDNVEKLKDPKIPFWRFHNLTNETNELRFKYLAERKGYFQKLEKAYGKETLDQHIKDYKITAILKDLFSF